MKSNVTPLSSALALLVTMAAGCAHVGTARLRIRCCLGYESPGGRCDEHPWANVVLDGVLAGSCSEWGGDGRIMNAGSHHIRVEDDSPSGCCVPADLDVDLPSGRTVVRAYLEHFPD
jgi:hypothetical protein